MTITDAQIVYVFIIPSLAAESTRVMETYIWSNILNVAITREKRNCTLGKN